MKLIEEILKKNNIKKINKMSRFKDNWNGYGSSSFSKDSIYLFLKIIEHVNRQPEIAPTGRSGLYMQYILKDKSILAFFVEEDILEKAIIPFGDYSKGISEVFYNNILGNVVSSVKEFYNRGE